MKTLGETRPLLDEQFAVLADVERRRLLVALLKENPRSDILRKIDESDSDAGTGRRRVVARHNHLPKLEDHGLVEWDRKNEIVAKGPEFEKIEPFLRVLDEHRDELPGDLS